MTKSPERPQSNSIDQVDLSRASRAPETREMQQDERTARFFKAVLRDQLQSLVAHVEKAEQEDTTTNRYIFADVSSYPPNHQDGLPAPLTVLRAFFASLADEQLIFPTDQAYVSTLQPPVLHQPNPNQPGRLRGDVRRERFVHFCRAATHDQALIDQITIGDAPAHLAAHLRSRMSTAALAAEHFRSQDVMILTA